MLKKKTIFILFCIVLNSTVFAQGYLKRSGQNIVNDNGPIILKSLGLGGWMLQEGYMLQTSSFANAQYQLKAKITALVGQEGCDQFYDAWLSNFCTKADIDSLAGWGFNSVRLPMHYNLFTLPIEEEPLSYQQTWLEKGFELTDNLLEWCKANNMYLILDLHGAPGGQGKDAAISDYNPANPSLWESARNRTKTVALWRKLAERYANEPWIGGYDLINETNWDMSGNTLLKNLYTDITAAIREVDQNHMIIIEGNWFANDFTGLQPPWDDNMIYSFHKYWSKNDKASIQWMLNIRTNHNIPIWCGESGENSNYWFTQAIDLMEKNNIGWAWWPLKKVESVSGPLSITKTEGYQRLLDYWNGSASKPSAEYAMQALLGFAESTNIANCQVNRDVMDAMFRQVKSNTTKPFIKHSLPGVVYAVDYDLGTNGVAYNDAVVADYHVTTNTYTAWNNGYAYRNDGVDIEACTDTDKSNGYNVGWIEAGEWLNYTVDVTKSGIYKVKFRVASNEQTGAFQLKVGNSFTSATINVPNTGGWQSWKNVEVNDVSLSKGVHNIKVYFTQASFNFNYMEFIGVSLESDSTTGGNAIYQNYPNPFTKSTTIPFSLAADTRVTLKIYNTNGGYVMTVFDGWKYAGENSVNWDNATLPSGVYIYRLSGKNFSETKKLLLLR